MRVLFVTHRLPYAANRGDRIRALNLLRQLATFAEVDLVSLVHDAAEASHHADLAGLAASVTVAPVSRARNLPRGAAALLSSRPLTHALLHAPSLRGALDRIVATRRPDVVVTSGSGIARVTLDPPLASVPHVLDMMDVDSEKWRALGDASTPPRSWLFATEARRMARFEAEVAVRSSAVLVVTERECAALHRLAPDARVYVLPVGIDVSEFAPRAEPSPRPVVTFCGVMSYEPNANAVHWFVRQIWPSVRARVPDAHFTIVGSAPGTDIRRLGDDPSVTVTGEVPDVRPYLWASAVSVAPLQVARGVQNKVLEAIAAGLPCVVSPVVADGLPPEVMPACRVGGTPAAFADAVVELLALQPQARRAMARTARLEALGWPTRLNPLRGIIESAAAVAAPA